MTQVALAVLQTTTYRSKMQGPQGPQMSPGLARVILLSLRLNKCRVASSGLAVTRMDELAAKAAQALAAYLAGTTNAEQFRNELRALTDGWSLSTEPAPKPGIKSGAVMRVFEYWKVHSGHTRARLTPERQRLIVARLKQGYSERDLLAAIRGCVESEFHASGGHDDLTLIMRSGSKVEGFMLKAGEDMGAIDYETEGLKRQVDDAMRKGEHERYKRLNEKLRQRIHGPDKPGGS